MTRTLMFLSTAVAGGLLAFMPASASAQSWGYGDGYRHYGYNDGYYRDGGRDHWRERRDSDEFTFGWAITCHKSQGSQYDAPIVFDESHAFREAKMNWLYTAVTRAAERVTVVV